MKAIKCPNCGKRMESECIFNRFNGVGQIVLYTCRTCGVSGPFVDAFDPAPARIAARLTREWIARMDADKRLDTHAQAAIDAIRDEVTDSADALTEEYMKWQEKGVPRPRDHAYREGRYHGAALSFKILSEAGFKATEVTHELG